MIAITLNGEAQPLPAGNSVADLLAHHGVAPEAVATAVNGVFIARGERAHTVLHEGDAVFTFQPITGG